MSHNLKPYKVRYIENPNQKELQELALEYTSVTIRTAYGSLNKISRNKARIDQYTYIIAPDAEKDCYSSNTIPPEKAQKLIESQRRRG
ncbi:MAG: hypothetical protein A3B74_00670 [Candidatus Kerfeldbacteria bacterium RIFCSPHIGHO2_02_FULL_42_14]|uniref:Uncharacterized protein n=1 Tax=Candidatus Kerfeldbacteria bacterium RIFCSPHIGHO2_02_FULL_42_14 TaxID=1798540 RepID=A0A1G2AR06_9BACT|nr:MAG: hypothetical protein A3B74_00670 [Candidatus Kerfeldbacteria bacterium RIFCSPHIGHO2_02_FULL_42_14]OGY81447.1 MAG: hypothetical protein A3E60_05475 [Candidatus Kerfeldbacteria bacterium RIFCSPHIGHO2_12_FULL_42_13]OGY83494.1 MAG: hypothetical protein A3I91_02505 [Candidatus Kerfeldbacteria bacterium RIFCSPLOWO2_02_FULL_42_19]OGY86980.1 MAG: hypothetical protein A3G01_01705 [Candidatus Kerfeldbacteria bacterium RIFCSPLOWO2_12_FULL_43_9]